jgi:hypothetical protein
VTYLRRFLGSISFYPVSTVYLASAAMIATVTGRYIRLEVALLIEGLVAIIAIQISMHSEVVRVHKLVNSQRDEMIARIDQLIATLVAAGVRVPDDKGSGPR